MKVYVAIGQKVVKKMPWSEACMHTKVADVEMECEILDTPCNSVQLYKNDHFFSAPILYSEAGFYRDDNGFYYVPQTH